MKEHQIVRTVDDYEHEGDLENELSYWSKMGFKVKEIDYESYHYREADSPVIYLIFTPTAEFIKRAMTNEGDWNHNGLKDALASYDYKFKTNLVDQYYPKVK